MDLAAINMQRGREHGVPGYGRWRDWCGLHHLSDWEDLHGLMPNKSIMVRGHFSDKPFTVIILTLTRDTGPSMTVQRI